MRIQFDHKQRGFLLKLGIGCLAAVAGMAQAQLVPIVTNSFRVQAGSIYDLVTSGNNNRGIAISPVSGNILYSSTAGGSNHVSVLDGRTGAYLHSLDANGISGGTLTLVGVRVAEDGAVYAVNLAGAGSTLKVYRWESEFDNTNPPVNVYVYSGSPVRLGDTIDVRGTSTNTQIIAAGSASSNPGNQWVLISPDQNDLYLTNNNWVQTFYDYPAGVAAGDLANGISFEGTNDVIYGKKTGSTLLRRIGFSPDPDSRTNWLLQTIDTAQTRLVGTKFYETNGVRLVAGIMYGSGTGTVSPEHRARVYDISNPSTPSLVLDDLLPGPFVANGNGIGAADIVGNKIAVLEPNNGIAVYNYYLSSGVSPTITAQPVGSTNILWGGYYSLTVSAGGSSPLGYSWRLNGTTIPGATNRALSLVNLDYTNAGAYTAVVTNSSGSVTSTPATLGIVASGASGAAQPLWSKTPGDLFFLTQDNSQRGLAYNPVTKNLILITRSPSNAVVVVNAATGAYIRSLDLTGVGGVIGSTYDVNMVAVADDGAIYVAGLTTGGGGYAIYRWQDDAATTQPTKVYEGDPLGERIGDALAAAGSGANTVLYASARNGTNVAVFTTFDGSSFTENVVSVTGVPAGFAGLGLFAAATNEFYASSGGMPLTRVAFDLANQTNWVVSSTTNGLGNINAFGVDSRSQLLFGIISSQIPQNLALYSMQGSGTNATVRLLDQDWFGSSNVNGNGTGQVAVDTVGGRAFALNSNNGLLAVRYGPYLRLERAGQGWVMAWAGNATLVSSTNVLGPYVDVPGATSPYTHTSPTTMFFRLRR